MALRFASCGIAGKIVGGIIDNVIDITSWVIDDSEMPNRERPHLQPSPADDAPPDPGQPAQRTVGSLVDELEEDIVLGRLHPRERITEDALIARFAAKRHLVREALATLERMGLIQRFPNRGAFVRELTPDEVENIYAVRALLEAEAARRAVERVTPDLIGVLSDIQRRHDAATHTRDMASAFRLNIVFHRAFYECCGNPELVEAIETYGQKAHGIRSLSLSRPDYLNQAGREHWAILHALERRDAGAVVDLCLEHIQVAKRAYVDAYFFRYPALRSGVALEGGSIPASA